ncbi:hypothetical protein, partial [Alicyclobacillus fastidiosus]|uniref:hypothetical protein n=1 Tax=Alicyclobacillus fastidiosus TaxID=392011 RepID=UPI0024E18B47
PQAEISDDGVKEVVSQIFQAYEQELDEAKWWTRLHIKLKSKGKRKTKTVNQEVMERKINVLPWELLRTFVNERSKKVCRKKSAEAIVATV